MNDGTPEVPDYILITENLLGIDYEIPAPRLVDIDDDGDLDLFVGHADNQLVYWKNIGSPEQPAFILENMNFLNTPLILNDYMKICFGDIDRDGDYDLIRGHYDYTLDFYRNIGTPEFPNLVLEEEQFLDIFMTLNPEPYLEDIDNDGDLDLFVGEWCGGVSFWRNNENPFSVELIITVSGSDIILTWGDVAGAVEYRIFYQDIPYFIPAGTPQVTVFPPDTTWIDYGAVSQGKRFYRLKVAGD